MRSDDLGFIASLAARWAALRDDVLSVASVSSLINGYAQLLDESGAWQREREMWNYNPVAFALRFTPRLINHDNYKETPRSNGCAIRAVKDK